MSGQDIKFNLPAISIHCKTFFRVIDSRCPSNSSWTLSTSKMINLFFCKRGEGICIILELCLCFILRACPQCARASSFVRFIDHTQRRTTVGRTPLDKWSARRRDLYLTTHTTFTTDIRAPGGIRTHILSRLTVADPRLRQRGHWDESDIATLKYDNVTSSPNIGDQTPNVAASCPRRSNTSRFCENLIRRAVHVQYNTGARACNNCCSGKAVNITCSECVSVALVIQHIMRTRLTISSCVTCLAVPYFFHII